MDLVSIQFLHGAAAASGIGALLTLSVLGGLVLALAAAIERLQR